MLNAIIRFSVRNKLIVGLFTVGWIIWGIIELTKLPVDALPDITSNQVQVITVTPALASPEVERVITFPIEQSCSNIPGIKEFRSISRFGLSVVTLVFDDETNIYWARQQVDERLANIRDIIPKDAGVPEMAPLTTGLGEIYQYVLKPGKGYEKQYDLAELRSIQDWIVRRQLLGTKGVADVSSFGGWLKQYEVAVNSERLKSMGLTIADLFYALEQNNQNSGGAYIEKGNEMLFIRTEGLTGAVKDIEGIRIKNTTTGIPVHIGDVAEVRIGQAVRYGAMTYGAEGEVAGAVVLMLKGANASQVVHDVKQRLEKIKENLPAGVELIPFYDRTKIVDRAISTVKNNLMEGALIVIFILVIFLGNLRASLIVASVIPLSMLFAVSMMNVFGVSGNLMSLGALDFGLIVDGAVIIVEAVIHRLYHRHLYDGMITQDKMDEAVVTSSTRMMNAAVFGQAIILIVYLPILSLTGIEGKMFRPMAQTVIFALIGAFILSLTYVPMMTSVFMSKKVHDGEGITDKIMNKLKSGYSAMLGKVFRFPKTVMVSTVVFFFFSLVVAANLGGEFIPKLEEGDFAVDARLLTGSTLTASVENSLKASEILQKFPEVEKIVTRIGSSEIPTDPMPVEMTDVMVTLRPKEEWTSAGSYEELANKMSHALKDIPGLTTGFQYPIQMRFNELIAGARQDVVCKIFGENLDSLASYAAKLGATIHGIEGARDVYVETVTGLPQIVIRYKREMMAMYGLDIKDVNRVIRTAFAGESAGLVYENERRFDLVVRLSEQSRHDIEHVQQLQVVTEKGMQIPLSAVADIAVEQGPNQIQREDAKRRIIVGFNTRGRDVQTVVSELQARIAKALPLPAGYYIVYGGQFENLVEAKQRLSIAVPIALGLIFLMLYFAFGSLRYGLLIFSAIPLSAIGGIISLWLRGMPFSISAGVGFIALFGVAVLNGIVLITEFNRLKNEGMTDVKQIIMEGSLLRLRPVLMTASVASFGFLPMALSHSAGAEVQRPLATVVIGGLITATLLTLVLLPLLYYWFSGQRKISKPGIMTVLILITGMSSFAQQGRSVSLDSMLSMAVRKNLALETNRKSAAVWETLASRTFELPRTLIGVEYGNINSFNNDTRIYIGQPFLMPGVYKSRKELYLANFESGKADVKLKEAELKREVRLNYYHMQDLLGRLDLMEILDSAYKGFLDAAALRYKTGETALLEKTSAETEYSRLGLQRHQVLTDLDILQARNNYLLRLDENLLPEMPADSIVTGIIMDTSNQLHPLQEYWQSRQAVYSAEINNEKTARLPEFIVGYNNLSIVGWQSPDGINQKYYGSGDRFSSFNLGMGIPLFNGAVKARTQAGEVNMEVARMNEQHAIESIRIRKTQLLSEYRKYSRSIEHYRITGNVQADQIIRQSLMAFKAGEISYMEWINLMNQAVGIRMSYLDALLAIRVASAELEYLNGN
jgi:cobalt-zinc-cadmium resistance protein CzcA